MSGLTFHFIEISYTLKEIPFSINITCRSRYTTFVFAMKWMYWLRINYRTKDRLAVCVILLCGYFSVKCCFYVLLILSISIFNCLHFFQHLKCGVSGKKFLLGANWHFFISLSTPIPLHLCICKWISISSGDFLSNIRFPVRFHF